MAGVTTGGFVLKSQEEIEGDVESQARTDISPSINTTSASLFGQLNGVFSSELAEVWEVLAALDGAISPITATGKALDKWGTIFGIARKDATPTQVDIQFLVDPGATVPAGTQVTNLEGDKIFETVNPFTNGGGFPILQDILSQNTVAGAVVVVANELNVAVGALPPGVLLIQNNTAGVTGTDEETDAEFRQRFYSAITGTLGKATVGSIEGALLAIPGINCALVNENTLGVCSSGIPPCSIEVVVWDPGTTVDPNVIAQIIFDKKPLGVYASGPVTGFAVDVNAEIVPINFAYVLEREIWVTANVELGPGAPSNAAALIQQAIFEYAEQEFSCGDDVQSEKLFCPIFEFSWVENVNVVLIGFSAGIQGTAPLEIGPREVAVFDTARISVFTV